MTSLCAIKIAEFPCQPLQKKIPCMPLSICFVSLLTERALELLEMTLWHLFQAREGIVSGGRLEVVPILANKGLGR